MATFNCVGLDASIDELRQMGADIDRRAARAATAGAEAAKAAMQRTVPVRTSGLRNHIAVEGPYHTVADGHHCEVYPKGTKRNGRKRERYETVGFVLEHGRSNMPAQPWMRPAIEKAGDEIAAAMTKELGRGG